MIYNIKCKIKIIFMSYFYECKKKCFLQRRCMDGQEEHKMMLNITNYWRTTYQNYIIKYYLTLVRMAIIERSTNNKCWRACREKGIPFHCWWE